MAPDQLGEAEVEDLHEAIVCDHQVLGLEVSMDDSGSVRLGKAIRHLRGELEKLLGGEWFPGKHCPECLAVDVLHGDVASAFVLADVVNGDDVRVVES